MSVNIQVTAETAQAAKALTTFTDQATAGLKQVAAGGNSSAQALNQLNQRLAPFGAGVRTSTAALQAFGRAGSLIGYQVAPQLTYAISAMTNGYNAISGAMKLSGVGLGAIGLGVAGVTGVVALGVHAWQAYKASLQETASEAALTEQRLNLLARAAALVKKNVEEGRLSGDAGAALQKRLEDAKTNEAMARAEASSLGRGTRATQAVRQLTSAYQRPFGSTPRAAETVEQATRGVLAEIDKVNLTAEQLKQLDELIAKTKQLEIATLDGYAKERAAAEEQFRLESARIELLAKGLKDQDQNQVKEAQTFNRLRHSKALADIDKKEREENLTNARAISEEIAKREQRADAFYKREDDHARQMQLHAISRNEFLTDAEKYEQSKAAGADMSGIARPDNLPEQMVAGWVAMQNQIGTIQQQIAQSWVNTMGAAVDSTTNSIMGLINRTMTWNDAWRNVASTVLNQVIGSIVRMGVQYLATNAMMTVAQLAGSKARGLADKKEGMVAGFKLASKAAGAVADIPYVGWALAVAAFASVMSMVTAASLVGGFQKGGFTGIGANTDVAGLVHRNEFVMPAEATSRIGVRNLELMRNGKMPATGASAAVAPNIKVVMVADLKQAAREVLESPFGQQVIVQTVNGKKLEMGFQT